MDGLQLTCPAKVNLVLRVGVPDRSPLHPLVSWMVAVGFSDTLWLRKANDGVSRFDIKPAVKTHAPDFDADQDSGRVNPRVCIDWPVPMDLAYRAHGLIQGHVGQTLAVNLRLRKRIPPGAGLGGGSSNAAATLVGLNQLFQLGLDDQTLLSLGLQLGSDVGFLVHAMLGHGSALVTGVGDQIQPLPLEDAIHLVLIFPGFACPTGAVYAAFDKLNQHGPLNDTAQHIRQLARHLPLAPEAPCNDLSHAAYAVRPDLKTIADRLHDGLRQPVHVSGSGSTLYLVAFSRTTASDLARKAATLLDLPTVATQTVLPYPSSAHLAGHENDNTE